ncbi:MAG: hypothetical protein II776_07890, partial [Clostridia bacterium]|nr:hypothetical protein [Clostridia bacterium]
MLFSAAAAVKSAVDPVRAVIVAAAALLIGLVFIIVKRLIVRARRKKEQAEEPQEKGRRKAFFSRQGILMALLDAIFIAFSYFGALILRFDLSFSNIPKPYLDGFLWSIPYWIIAAWVVYYLCRLYQGILRFASVADLSRLVLAYLILIPVYVLGGWFMGLSMPRFYLFVGYALSFMFAAAIRFSYRLLLFVMQTGPVRNGKREKGKDVIMIIGAGEAGRMVVREFVTSDKVTGRLACIIDDDRSKIGHFLEGVPIVGDRYEIVHAAERYGVTRIILAIPTLSSKDRRDILIFCQKTTCKLQIVPGVYQLVDGSFTLGKMRDVDVTDLLGREEIRVNNDEILSSIHGKTVLVTGGG